MYFFLFWKHKSFNFFVQMTHIRPIKNIIIYIIKPIENIDSNYQLFMKFFIYKLKLLFKKFQKFDIFKYFNPTSKWLFHKIPRCIIFFVTWFPTRTSWKVIRPNIKRRRIPGPRNPSKSFERSRSSQILSRTKSEFRKWPSKCGTFTRSWVLQLGI